MKFYEAIEPIVSNILCCANVEFSDSAGNTSTTQFDIQLGTRDEALAAAWYDFCEDNGIAEDAIVNIEFVPGDGIFS